MAKISTISRLILGLIYVVFGLNFFFQFIPVPPAPEAGANFLGALMATGYMFQWIKVTEIAGGLLLLLGVYVPLALVLLAPITLNILVFHLVLTPEQNPAMAIGVTALHLAAALGHWSSYKPLFKAK